MHACRRSLLTFFINNIGQGSRYLVLAPAGRGRGRGSTKTPAPIAPMPINLPSIKSESNGTLNSSHLLDPK